MHDKTRHRQEKNAIRIADFFSGCGGLTAGAVKAIENAGRTPKVSIAIDINPKAIEVYKNNFSAIGSHIHCADINKYLDYMRADKALITREKSAFKPIEPVDILIAGPPCQGHSSLNNSSRRLDPRNMLYWAPIRAAILLRPQALLIENVPGVTLAQERVIEGAKECLISHGYHVAEETVELSRLGVPQKRKRHVLIATLEPYSISNFYMNSSRKKPRTASEALTGLEDRAKPDAAPEFRTTKLSTENRRRIDYLFDNNVFDLPNSMRPPCHRDKSHSYVSMYGRIHPDKPAQTITSGFGSMGQGRFVHPSRRRMITAREAARLQGFSDNFSFEGIKEVTTLREMIGNAVPPALSYELVKELILTGQV